MYYVVSEGTPAFGQFSPILTLDAFKANHDRIFTKDITPSALFDIGGVGFLNNQVVVFTYGFVNDQGGDILNATTCDVNNQAGTAKQLAKWSVDKMSNRGRYKVVQSPNLQYVSAAYEPEWRKGENEQVQLTMYDVKLNAITQSTQTLPYEWKRGVNNSYFINDQGTAFILKRTVVGGEDNNYSILTWSNNKLTNYVLSFGDDKKIVSAIVTIAPNGFLAVGGYYSEDKKVRIGSTNYHGNFLFTVSPDGSTLTGKYVYAFDEKRKDMQLKYLYATGDRYFLIGQEERSSSTISADREKAMKGEYDYKYFVHDIYTDAFDVRGSIFLAPKCTGTWILRTTMAFRIASLQAF